MISLALFVLRKNSEGWRKKKISFLYFKKKKVLKLRAELSPMFNFHVFFQELQFTPAGGLVLSRGFAVGRNFSVSCWSLLLC